MNLRNVLLLAETQETPLVTLNRLTVVRALLLLVTENVLSLVTVPVMTLAFPWKPGNLNMLIGLPYRTAPVPPRTLVSLRVEVLLTLRTRLLVPILPIDPRAVGVALENLAVM